MARKIGKVEAASGGTLFLDEIGELPAELQAKLLRVLQERSFARVGGTEEIHSDIRVVCATNSDLEADVREGRFREDLFYRLHVSDSRAVVARAARRACCASRAVPAEECAKQKRAALKLTDVASAALVAHEWPGNVRELKNAIERAVILAEGDAILPEHLPAATPAIPSGVAVAEDDLGLLEVGRRAQREAERRLIRRALEASGGNRTEAAKKLGVSYKTLWSKLKEYEIGEER